MAASRGWFRSLTSTSALTTPNERRRGEVARAGVESYSTSSASDHWRHYCILQGNDRKYIFLGIDDTMHIGIHGPSNLFGHPTDDQINALESELQYWNNCHPRSSVTKVVFGHFPMSFTALSEKGDRYETIFARQSVSAYICGHLHAKFSKQLWRQHFVEVSSHDSRVSKNSERAVLGVGTRRLEGVQIN